MVKLTVLYGHPVNPDAFEEHYANTHTPLALKIPNLGRLELAKVVATPEGSAAPYYRIADLWFQSMDELESALGSPEGQAAAQDFHNFASGGVTLLISAVQAYELPHGVLHPSR